MIGGGWTGNSEADINGIKLKALMLITRCIVFCAPLVRGANLNLEMADSNNNNENY